MLAAEDSPHQPAYVLILEDYHVITTQPIHEALTYLIDNLPPHVHVLITTRADPPLPFSRWRARDQLLEIRATDLRFTPDEAAMFLNERMDLQLTMDDVRALETRTEGWIAGLQLVALSLQGRPDKADFLQTFSGSHRYVFNYLVEEVLNQQAATVQTFLLQTAILDRLCGPLCDAVIAAPLLVNHAASLAHGAVTPIQSQAMLEQIEQANLFLTPLDDEGRWFRYHPLFAEVLRHRLRQTQSETLPHLHRRASVWYEQQGLLTDAIHHALRAADFARTAELIEQSWPTAWNQGAVATLLNWVEALPIESVVARPTLALSYAWALALAGRMEAADASLQQVETWLQVTELDTATAPTVRNTLLGRIAALRAMMTARRGESLYAIQLARDALRLIPSELELLRGNAYYALGLAEQQHGTLPAALRAYHEAARLGIAAGDHFLTIAARYHAGRIWMAQGQLRMAANTYQVVLTATVQHERPAPLIGLAHVGYAEILYRWNELTAAAQHIENGLALSPSGSLTYTDGPFHRFLTLARIRQALGDQAGALSAAQLATDTAQQTGISLDAARAAALQALVHLRRGQPEFADQWAQRYAPLLMHEDHYVYTHEFETLVFARVLLAQARPQEVLSLLARWLPTAEAAQRMGSVIEISMLQAQALQLDGQSIAAEHMLTHLLAQTRSEGDLRLFLDEGEPMRLLLHNLQPTLADADLRAYTETILSAFDNPPSSTPEAKIQNLVEPLTSRELEVLRLITAGLSNAEIAEQLVITVSTVKSHLKHMYGKLAVRSRTQAVAQARQLGLL